MKSPKTIGVKVGPPEEGGRRLVITDIHGCINTFIKLLDKVALTKKDQLFLLGDYINRGPKSKKTLDHILKLISEGYQVYPLMGNHEESVLNIIRLKPNQLKRLLKYRKSTKLLNKKGKIRKRFFKFFRELPYYYELDKFYLVHAGFNMKIDKPLTDVHTMTWTRSFQLKKKKLNKKCVVYGHTPSKIRKIRRTIKNNAKSICLDNGCSHKFLGKEYNSLVCYDLDSRNLFRQRNID